MKKIFLIAALVGNMVSAQAQNWVANAKKAVFSVVTYDKDGNVLNNGNGFYIGNDGTALSDYKLFLNASKAVVIDTDGQKSEVALILGANEIYDVVKFKVNVSKKINYLTLASSKASVNQMAYILPYSNAKVVTPQKGIIKDASDVAENYKFYTISTTVEDKDVSCPVLNDVGQVIGLIQKGTDNESYAIDTQYANSLNITALSPNDYVLNNINIDKALPDSPDQALVYVMMTGNTPSAIEQLIKKYPDLGEAYLRRATNEATKGDFAAADKDLATFLEKSEDKAEAHYQISKLIYNINLYNLEDKALNWNFERALEEADLAISINAISIFMKHKADVLFALGNYQESYTEFEKLLNSDLKNYEIYSYLADCKQRMGGTSDEVIDLYSKAANEFSKPYPNEAAPYIYALAVSKANAGKYREAVTDYNEVEHIYGGRANAEFYYNRSLAEKNCRMYQQAQQDINEAMELSPQDEDILVENASLHVILKEYTKVQNVAERLILVNENNPLGYRFLGFAQAMNGNKTEAKQNLEKAKALGDENADTIIQKYCK